MIQGEQVDLRPTEDDDFEYMSRWVGGPSGALSNGVKEFATPDRLRSIVRENGLAMFTILSKSGQVVGFADYRSICYAGNHEIGVSVGEPEHWKRGYGYEAGTLLMWYLFHELNAHRLQMVIGSYNGPMLRLVHHSPWTVEGVLRDYYYCDGEYHDAILISLLRDEFYAMHSRFGKGVQLDAIPVDVKRLGAEIMTDIKQHLKNGGDGL